MTEDFTEADLAAQLRHREANVAYFGTDYSADERPDDELEEEDEEEAVT